MSRTIIALIPAYEPTPVLGGLVKTLTENRIQVLVVNDGSSTDCNAVFEEASHFAVVLNHPQNKGKGCALKTGLIYIQKQFESDSIIVTLDADGQHSIADTLLVANAAMEHPSALTIGCRSFQGDVPAKSRFGNTVTRFVYRISTGVTVHDTQTGLRAFGSELLDFLIDLEGERYEYEMNVLLACTRTDIPIREVTIQTIYYDNNAGSHFHPVRDSFRIYRNIIRFGASSFLSFLIDYGLYSILTLITAGLSASVSVPLSNITARVVSASVNFSINRRIVFKHQDNVRKAAVSYFLLAAGILAGNTVLLDVLVEGLGVNRFAAKLITELTFFVSSFLVQNYIIFRRSANKTALQIQEGDIDEP